MSSASPPAVILGGHANAVSVARALGSSGVPVYALGWGPGATVKHSRFTQSFISVDKHDLQGGWLSWLESEATRLEGAVLLPCGDDGLELIARNRGFLEGLGYRPIEADDDVVLTMLDKSKTYALARQIDVPSPRTVALEGSEDIALAVSDLGYPCALKALHTHEFARRGVDKVIVVHDAGDLEAALRGIAAHGLRMLATELIPGPVNLLYSYYSYMDENGVPLFHATKRKLRQFPVGFGAASYGVTQWDAEVAELGSRFFRKSGVRGLAEAEFKRDPRDGVVKLIECNHRFTGSNELVRAAGIDLALLAYNRVVGRPDPPLGSYRDGVYLWGPILDSRAFRTLRRQGELTTVDWVRSLLHRQHFAVFQFRDPKPTAMDVGLRAKLVLEELVGNAKRSPFARAFVRRP
jgi:D-aspartate ligase